MYSNGILFLKRIFSKYHLAFVGWIICQIICQNKSQLEQIRKTGNSIMNEFNDF